MIPDLNSIQVMMRSVRALRRLGNDSELTPAAQNAYQQTADGLRYYAVEQLSTVITSNSMYPCTLAHEIADRLR